ncbi:malto-oligosyltrehalose synthase [Gryllotalpicola kribbensis]|uniref:Malto-oligosyltrehalose synthase n=1 Tax=Gryllotalpicola kribbensis TaxID=993084 RepID=A0ABP8AYZ6_9MICO
MSSGSRARREFSSVEIVPANSYRLQLSADFTLFDAAAQIPYLRRLGVDWLYLSPLLEAASGSAHGYDVVDHGRVDAARGGAEGLERLAETAHAAGMGVLVDIVPNHMGVGDPAVNPWWRDVLEHGHSSEFADFFDIDWDAGDGRVKTWPDEVNYRRFFAINELAALRVEDPGVFDASHREIARWFAEGLVDGVRVDHPDGLRDPGAYLERLSRAVGGAPIWVEKILEGDERLPPTWPVEGTTGYDALGLVDRVFIDPRGEAELTRVADDATGAPFDWPALAADRKREVARGVLHPDVARIARELGAAVGGGTEAALVEEALVELAAALPVYRTYLPFGREYLDAAAARASAARPGLAAAIARTVAGLTDPGNPGAARFQQTSGMIMAKGVEDSAFYRYPRLTSLNEVGGDPSWFALAPDGFHERQAARAAQLPGTMTALTTHDTKRSEDARARIAALSEVPAEWAALFAELRELTGTGHAPIDELVWQAIIGAWPASAERLVDYALKAAREAGDATSWTAPDEEFEARLAALARSPFENGRVGRIVADFAARIAPAGWSNGLGMKLLQLLSPGMPDVYQGTERWDRSLVDPDNRRPVDYAASSELLARLDDGWLPPVDDSGAAKLLVVSRALRLRRDRPELLQGYAPVRADGPRADHLIGVDRGGAAALATRLPLGLQAAGGWDGDTVVELHGRDELTGQRFDGRVPLGTVFARYPVALVVTA